MRKFLKFLASLFIGIFIFWLVMKMVGWGKIGEALVLFSGFEGLIIILLTFTTAIIGVLQWKLILQSQGSNIPTKELGKLWLVGFTMSYLTPCTLLGGEALQVYLLKKRFNLNWEKSAASVIIDRILSGTFFLMFLIAGILAFYFYGYFPSDIMLWFVILVTGGLFGLLLFFYFKALNKKSILKWFLKFIGINKEKIKTYHDNTEALQDADIILLAVKPGQMKTVLEEITPFIPTQCLLISVAAGLNLDWFAPLIPSKQALIRTMPNTPAAVGMAATPLCSNQYVTTSQKKAAERIFSIIGITTWVAHEEEMDTFTALSGSGPAYVFLFMQAMIQAAVTLGLNQDIANTFALQTVGGALKLATESHLSFSELKTKVTSPGGTTAAALNVLEGELEPLVLKAISAAQQRARELARTNL